MKNSGSTSARKAKSKQLMPIARSGSGGKQRRLRAHHVQRRPLGRSTVQPIEYRLRAEA